MDVSISVNGQGFEVLASFDDFRAHDMVTVTNFTLPIKVPAIATEHAVLRVRYISNNPLEVDPANNSAAVFYNCADIKISDSADEVSPVPEELLSTTSNELPLASSSGASRVVAAGGFSCAPPPLFHAYAETASRAGVVVHEIWYMARVAFISSPHDVCSNYAESSCASYH